ncbi:RNA polymerase sigma factor [Actinokineospora terrae]|uniref:DNA-directed RNA polymerase specialized sigma subunit, sigma24 family n=1 Tax=Actinokineospora terrae TaxID=155974 RepID=A0A1H9MZM0_9PSEU|nr:sigma-70 family RNA polymerase sigma factor [Actinokineospora terrae]SER28543.1 DNA-directed RNA polymerase specialized sigma subunit, sigma24 family [Actinokineospora terrae]
MTDDLLAGLHTGTDDARRQLFRRCQSTLRPYFRRRLPATDDIDDCVSEVVTRALEGFRRGLRPDDLDAWIGGIARNVLKERYDAATQARARVSGELPDLPSVPVLDLDHPPETAAELEHLMGKRQLSAAVDDAIVGLSPALARVMREHVQLSRAARKLVVGTELASALNMPVADLNRQLGRARERTPEAIVALVLARGSSCPGLTAIVGEQTPGVVLDPVRSRAVTKHAGSCEVCGQHADQVDAFSKWALGPGLVGLAEDDEERRRAVIALFSRGVPAEAVPMGLPLGLAPRLGVVDRARVVIATRMASMPRAVTDLAVQNPDAFRRVVAAVLAGTVLVAAAIVALVIGGDGETDAATGLPGPVSSTSAPPSTITPSETGVPETGTSALPASTGSTVVAGSTASDTPPAASGSAGTKAPGAVAPAVATTPSSTATTTSGPSVVVPEPARWGYVLVNQQSAAYPDPRVEQQVTTESTWGTWRAAADPSVSQRKPTVVHDGPGQYRVRLPGLASEHGVAQMSVNFMTVYAGANARSCGVVDSHPEAADQFVTVACHNASGAAKDAPFGVLFVVPGTGGAPMVTVRHNGQSTVEVGDSTGGRPVVTRVGAGRYRVSLDGAAFNGRGYAQVTAYGGGPAQCQNEDVAAGELSVACWTTGGLPVDTGWHLSYVERGPLTHDAAVPGAYAQMAGAAPGLTVDPDRSFNSANGYMTVERASAGLYRVGFRGVGRRGDILLATAMGSAPGHCVGQYLVSYQQAGDTWATVACVDPAGKPVDRRFGVAVIRPPGPLVGALGAVVPRAAAPKWGYARMTAHDIPLGVETTLDGQWAWTSWSRGIPLLDALWVRKATVVHQGVGRYRVRLPGIGSAAGLAHVTPFSSSADSCSIVDNRADGVDELVDVACFGATGSPKDLWFNVFFGEPVSAVMIRSDSLGVTRTAPGRYDATTDIPFAGTGHPQLTPVGPTPARCRVAAITTPHFHIACDTPTGVPTDSAWQLTYVEGAGLHQDPTTPAAYATIHEGALDLTRTYTSNASTPTLTSQAPGRYTLTYPDIAPIAPYPADSIQLTALSPHHCTIPAWNSYSTPPRLTIQITCTTPTPTTTAPSFTIAYLRRSP